MCELNSTKQNEKSLGIIKPKQIMDVIVEETDRDWKPQWKAAMAQGNLFGPNNKPLEKIPYIFRYKFLCEDPICKEHTMMIEDWEIGQLYRNLSKKYNENDTVDKVKDALLNKIGGSDVDTHFFVGTVLKFGSWVIIGTFWPKK